jgi:hypothetical protein
MRQRRNRRPAHISDDMLIHIEPLGCGSILPAFVVGYPLEDDEELGALDVPPSIVVIEQQAGGVAMSYPVVMGAVLRLEANRHRGLRDLEPLLRGLRAMAEEPDLKLLEREYKVLRNLALSSGSAYIESELRSLQDYLAAYLALPPLVRGIEAYVEHAACDPRDYFAQWGVMSCTLVEENKRQGSIYRSSGAHYTIDESNLADVRFDDNRTLADTWQEIEHLGRQLQRPGPAQLFFLWENSD